MPIAFSMLDIYFARRSLWVLRPYCETALSLLTTIPATYLDLSGFVSRYPSPAPREEDDTNFIGSTLLVCWVVLGAGLGLGFLVAPESGATVLGFLDPPEAGVTVLGFLVAPEAGATVLGFLDPAEAGEPAPVLFVTVLFSFVSIIIVYPIQTKKQSKFKGNLLCFLELI